MSIIPGNVYTSKLHALNGCKIGEFEITDNGLSYKPFPRSEQGVKMFYDGLFFNGSSNKTFHRVGTQVISATAGMRCFSFIQNERRTGVGSIISLGEEIERIPITNGGLGQYINCPQGTSLHLEAQHGTALHIKNGSVKVDEEIGIDTIVTLGNTQLVFKKGILVEHRY